MFNHWDERYKHIGHICYTCWLTREGVVYLHPPCTVKAHVLTEKQQHINSYCSGLRSNLMQTNAKLFLKEHAALNVYCLTLLGILSVVSWFVYHRMDVFQNEFACNWYRWWEHLNVFNIKWILVHWSQTLSTLKSINQMSGLISQGLLTFMTWSLLFSVVYI